MTKVSTPPPSTTYNVKDAMHTGMGAIEQTVLAAAEIPLSVLKSLGISDEAMEAAREGHRQLVSGIHSALSTIADGVADTATGIATGIAGAATAATGATADAVGKAANGSSKS